MDHLHRTSNGPGLQRSWTHPLSFNGLRVVPWRGDPYTGFVGPKREGRRPTVSDVAFCLDELRARGVARAITPALNHFDAQPFLDAGFGLHEHLHLLARRLSTAEPKPDRRTHRGYPWHLGRVLDVDAAAFEPFWQFDRISLREARQATPRSRFRVAVHEGAVVGYAVTGRAGQRGYLQRLAVAPEAEGQGIGTALVNDGFAWLAPRGVTTVMVNTQEHNRRALALYEHLGFDRQDPGLIVLTWDAL